MLGSTLLMIVGGPDLAAQGQAMAERVLAAWPQEPHPEVQTVTAEAILAGDFETSRPTVAWLLGGSDPSLADEFALIDALQEKHLAVAVARPEMSQAPGAMIDAGVVACPADADPAVIATVLLTMFANAPMLQGLARDVQMLHAQSAGMAGQFDKIDEELRMALKIQREFLPKALPEVDGLAFDVLWRPACYVGGDIYDVVRLDENHVGIFIADAVGHGMPAALMTIFIKQATVMRQITPGIGPGYRIAPPGEALAGLNRAMIEQDAGAASLGTAVYGVLNTQTQRLTLARAGHPAPLLLRGNGQTQWLEPDGAMLGVFPEEVFEEQVTDLQDGDRLILYSDGFEVAFPGCEGKGRLANEHFVSEFEGLRLGSGQEALDFLQGRLDEQSGSLNQRDDLTVVCTSVKSLADVAHRRAEADRVTARSVA